MAEAAKSIEGNGDSMAAKHAVAKAAEAVKRATATETEVSGLLQRHIKDVGTPLRDLKERAPAADWSLYGALNSTRSAVAELRDQLSVRSVPLEACMTSALRRGVVA